MGWYNSDNGTYEVLPQEVAAMRVWLAERGGIAIWNCHDLSDPGKTWTTPVNGPDGKPVGKPHWAAGEIVGTVTDPGKVIVTVPRLVKRFHVGVRMGGSGLKLKLTDASSRRVRDAVAKAGEGAWHEFDYMMQDALIYAPGEQVPLKDWKRPEDAKVSEGGA